MKKIFIYIVLLILSINIITSVVLSSSDIDKSLDNVLELIKDKKFDKALEIIREVIKKDPNESRAYFYGGIIYMEKKDYNQAVKLFEQALTYNPGSSGAYYNKGICYKELKKFSEAYTAFCCARDLYKSKDDDKGYNKSIQKIKELEASGYIPQISQTPKPVNTPVAVSTKTPGGSTPMPMADMVFIRPGEFLMGSDDNDLQAFRDEIPGHKVYLDAFYIDKFEVTNGQYCKFLNAKGTESGSGNIWIYIDDTECKIEKVNGQYRPEKGYENYPVVDITWYGADTYAQWAGKTLPSEAQWERAARGKNNLKYPWGNEWDKNKCNNMELDISRLISLMIPYMDKRGLLPVGSIPEGQSSEGIMDMAGNVSEWCDNYYDPLYYSVSPEKNPPGPSSGPTRVCRGGSWRDNAFECRSARRFKMFPDQRYDYLGFRTVKLVNN